MTVRTKLTDGIVWLFSPNGVVILARLGGAIAAIVIGFSTATTFVVVHNHTRTVLVDHPLRWAVVLVGAYILGHLALELLIQWLPEGSSTDPHAVDPDSFSSVATVLVTTPAVVLGLLAAFGKADNLNTAVKVGAGGLVAALLLAIVMNGVTSMTGIDNPPRSVVVRLFFNFTLWALALGLLGITLGLIYRK